MPRYLSFAMFLSLFCALVAAAHYYIYSRLVAAPAPGDSIVLGGGIACGLAAIGTPVGVVLSRVLPRPLGRPLGKVVYTWFGMLVLLLSSLGLSELVRLVARTMMDEPAVSRTIAGGVALVTLAAAAYGARRALGPVGVKRVAIGLSRLPASLAGFRIVQLSDLHVGPTLGRDWLQQIVDTVNDLSPDIVVITGDLVDGSVRRLREQVAPLAGFVVRHGVFFVTGNHEYYSGVDAWLKEFGRLGIRTLRNERVSIGEGAESFDLAGVDDWNAFGDGHGRDLAAALEGRDDSRELVLLAHQPRQIAEAARRGVGLQLSGHTHGGQIFPWHFFVRLQQPYVAGLSRRDDTQIYVSCGTGFWGPPMRVGAPAEITLLELNPG